MDILLIIPPVIYELYVRSRITTGLLLIIQYFWTKSSRRLVQNAPRPSEHHPVSCAVFWEERKGLVFSQQFYSVPFVVEGKQISSLYHRLTWEQLAQLQFFFNQNTFIHGSFFFGKAFCVKESVNLSPDRLRFGGPFYFSEKSIRFLGNSLDLLEESYGRLHEWSEAYFVTLIDRCSFLCVSGQRGTIAKSMHEEHLCIVALTSNGARNPVLSACLLPPRVIAYCSSSTSR